MSRGHLERKSLIKLAQGEVDWRFAGEDLEIWTPLRSQLMRRSRKIENERKK